MTCAKIAVVAVLIGASGREYRGTNECLNPQEACPREPGEGYAKCRSVCMQPCHAEVDALIEGGEDAEGGTMLISHHYACADCVTAMNAAGVKQFKVGVAL